MQRELRGVSREEISRISKISLYRLEALEEGRWDVYPAPVYLMGAIRSYARALGMDEEDAILHLKETVPYLATNRSLPATPTRKKSLWFPALLFYTLIGLFVVIALLYFIRSRR